MKITFRKWLEEMSSEDHFGWVDKLLAKLMQLIQEYTQKRVKFNPMKYQGFIANIQSSKNSDPRLMDIIPRFYEMVKKESQWEPELRKMAGVLEYYYSQAYGEELNPTQAQHNAA